MDQNITENILKVCNALSKHSVEYLSVGGTAVALHGYFRWSLNQASLSTNLGSDLCGGVESVTKARYRRIVG